MNRIISIYDAEMSAVSYSHLEGISHVCTYAELTEGMFALTIYVPLMKYDFYIDAVSGEVLGMDSRPDIDTQGAMQYNAA